MDSIALDVSDISKKFKTDFWKKSFVALDHVSFQVPKNSVCGLIGPNGAGKTTAIKIILDFIRANTGSVKIFGEDSKNKNVHQKIGYLPEHAYYYDYLNPVEFLDFYGKLFGLSKSVREERTESLLKLVGLYEKKDIKLRGFSKGMLQRIGIAQALINDPSLVIFDEPMSGLDPIGRKEVRDIILKLKESGKTVLFSTHILPDVENLCDRAVMIVKGKLHASGSVAQLIQPNVQSYDVVLEGDPQLAIPAAWSTFAQVRKIQDKTTIRFNKTNDIHQESILSWIQDNRHSLVSFVPHRENLEDILVRSVERS